LFRPLRLGLYALVFFSLTVIFSVLCIWDVFRYLQVLLKNKKKQGPTLIIIIKQTKPMFFIFIVVPSVMLVGEKYEDFLEVV